MKKFYRIASTAFFSLVALTVLAPVSGATSVVMLSDEELILDSRLILTGRVQSLFSVWNDAGTTINTYVEVRVESLLKGELSSDTLVLKQLGGIVQNEGVRFLGHPVFEPDQEVLLYLKPGADRSLHVAHAFMGMFLVKDDGSGKSVHRWDGAGEVLRLSTSGARADVTDSAPLEQYVRMIRDTLARNRSNPSTQSAGQDFVAIPAEYARKKQHADRFAPQFVFIANGVRWMQADSDQPVSYRMNPDRAPIAGGGTAELTRAMNAWSAQSGARLRLQLSGQTSACGVDADGLNTISFGDCENVIDPPIGCSGVLAQTTVGFTSETKSVGGQVFRRIVDSDLVFNDGMDCFLRISANLAETTCHELGHSIGLGHSADSAAIMWSSVRGGGRDATLGTDDRAGVLAIYPSSGGGSNPPPPGPVSIASSFLPRGTAGEFYRETLTATGGTSPYTWRVIGGQAPPGLSLSTTGIFSGRPTQAGFFQMSVQVVDSTPGVPGSDVELFSVTIDAAPSIFPLIDHVKVKGTKKLFIFGSNFRGDSQIMLNGRLLTPKEFTSEGGTDRLFFKGKLKLGPAGTNVVQVINPNGSSSPFVF
jgi:hypothetical protein